MARTHAKAMTAMNPYKITESILARRFKAYGYKTAIVTEEEDFDGESILRMVVDVRRPVPTDELVDTINEIRTALLKSGDDRFVFLRARLPDEDRVDQDAEP